MTAGETRRIGQRRFRPARFALGLIAGVLLFFVVVFVAANIYDELVSGDVELRTSGGEISAHGGTRLALRRNTGVIVQSCNDTCDDLHVLNSRRSNGLRDIRVLNEAGDCIACARGRATVFGGWRDAWAISGASRLRIARSTLRAWP